MILTAFSNALTTSTSRARGCVAARGGVFLRCVLLFLLGSASFVSHAAGATNMARAWNERALVAIRMDTPHPPGQARNLFSLSVCMYDAWAAYDTNGAVGFIYHNK